MLSWMTEVGVGISSNVMKTRLLKRVLAQMCSACPHPSLHQFHTQLCLSIQNVAPSAFGCPHAQGGRKSRKAVEEEEVGQLLELQFLSPQKWVW